MTTEAEINRNHSLGRLRPAQKTKPRSPDCIGKLHLKRDHLLIFLKQVEQSRVDEVTCNIAGWKGNDVYGPFMTIEISPRFEKRLASHNSDPLRISSNRRPNVRIPYIANSAEGPTCCSIWNRTNRKPRLEEFCTTRRASPRDNFDE